MYVYYVQYAYSQVPAYLSHQQDFLHVQLYEYM